MTKNISSIPGGKVRSYAIDSKTTEQTLRMLGINYSQDAMAEFRHYAKVTGQDAAPALQTTPSNMTPVQFLQYFIPEVIRVITASRDADAILGRDFAGTWSDEKIVQPVVEHTGQSRPYGDKTNKNLSGYNLNFEERTIVRFEEDVEVGKLEEERAAKVNINAAGELRLAAAESLAINANLVAFFGYNAGVNKTYGILNDPNLGAYQNLPAGSSGQSEWADKTFNEIVADIKTAMATIRVQTGNRFKPERDASVLTLPVSVVDQLQTVNGIGTQSVKQWLNENYPNCRIESAVQFDGANGGDNVFYLTAETLDGKKTANQYMQDALRLVGVEMKAKGFLEVYSNATAGAFYRQPVGTVRFSGC